MGLEQSYYATLAVETCCNCGMKFGMDSQFKNLKRADGGSFYCPAGHGQHYAETDVARLEKELEAQKKRTVWAETARDDAHKYAEKAERRARAYKGIVRVVKKRVGNGVCPCCNRTFQNLLGHMKTKHPKFKGTKK